jgi:CubicO group peptidase (beta-lactamase class C family)
MKQSLLILLAFGLAQLSFAQPTTSAKLDELITAYAKINRFNGSVLVYQKGKILLQKGYGTRTNGIFQIYSVTKTFTSTLLLQLVEKKKIALTDKLSKFYPGFPNGDSITIKHLLSHSSGIYDYTRGNDMPNMKEQTLVDFLSKKPLDFPPGKSWSYSNSGYYLLGYIIERVTGMPYEQAIHKYILDPLKMTNSGFDFKRLSHPDKTTGYAVFTSTTKKESVIYDAPGAFAAGAIYSTTGDLLKYHLALQKNRLLSVPSLDKAYTPVLNNYGLGWIITDVDGKKMVAHSGGADGFRSNFARIPADDICIVLLSNNELANLDIITRKVLDILVNKPYKLPVEVTVAAEKLQSLCGTYTVNKNFNLYVNLEDGRLTTLPTGQSKTILLAQTESSFYVEEIDGLVEFKIDAQGSASELIIHQNGQLIPAKRIYPGWGVLGSATTVGWDGPGPDIAFVEDAQQKGVFTLANISLKDGEIKFRFNNDWTINYGADSTNGLLHPSGKNINVAAGIYDIVLDLRDLNAPKFRIAP